MSNFIPPGISCQPSCGPSWIFSTPWLVKEKKSNLSAIGKMSDSLSGIDCGRQRAETAAGRCKLSMNINHA
jgi:hypothetical protein